MTLRERLSTIGRAFRGDLPVKEVIKEVKKAEKYMLGSVVDFKPYNLSGETTVSSKVLEANTGWVYRNNDVIAKEVATIEFELFTIRLVGQEIQYNSVTSHPILDALDRFNDATSASDGFYTTQSHRKLAGDAFWYLEGSGPNIQSINILPPDKVEIEIEKVEGSQKIISGYHYRDTIKGSRVDVTYTPEEIIHFKVPNPKNPLRGLSTVAALAADIDLDTLAILSNIELFRRGLISSFVLSTDNSLTPEQIEQLRAQLTANYGGVRNAHKIPIFSGGLEPKNIQLTNKEMEFMGLQEWVRDKITSGFGNSKAVLGVTDDVNRANAEATIMNWKRTTIRSEMKQITDTLNEFLVPRFGSNMMLGFKDPVQEDKSEKITDVKAMIEANVITPNEAREILGYDSLPDADYLREGLKIPEIPKSLQLVNHQKFLRGMGIYKQQELYRSVKAVTDKKAKQIVGKRHKQQPVAERNVEAYYNKQLSIVEVAEVRFQNKLEQIIRGLVDKALQQVPNEIKDIQNKQLFDEQDEVVRASFDLTPILAEVATAAGNIALDMVDYDKPYILLDFRKEIEKRVKLFASSMVETDRNKIIDIITNGVQEGHSVAQIRSNITDTFESYTKSQAERITRTEVLRVSNKAAIDAWEQSGVVEGKEWLTAPGADAECEQYNGQVVALGREFYSGQNEFEDGDPPIHPNCRCVVLPVLIGEKTNYSMNSRAIELEGQVKEMQQQISLLEAGIDKRTKQYKAVNKKWEDSQKEVEDLKGYVTDLEKLTEV